MRRALLAGLLVVGLAAASPLWAQELSGVPPEHGNETELREEVSTEGPDHVLLWKTLNFALLIAALVWFGRKPAKAYFASATGRIRQGIDEATRARQEAEERAAEMDRRLADLGVEIAALRSSAHEEMAAEEARLRKQTEGELMRVQHRAQQEIASAASHARRELRAEAAQLAMELAQRKVRERMTPEVANRLVDAFVDDMGDAGRRAS